MTAKHGLDNSQSFIFNSKANLTGLLPTDGLMSFSKATDDGHNPLDWNSKAAFSDTNQA